MTSELVTRALEEKELKWLGEVPTDLLLDYEQDVFNFILDYDRKHGDAPSIKRVMEEFDAFIPYKHTASSWEPTPPPIGDVFEQTVQRKLFEAIENLVYQAQTEMSREGRIPMDTFAVIDKLYAMSTGVHRYSTFDRDLYFRRTTFDLPFKIINSHIGGLGNGDYMLIIGRLGTGKSTVAQWIAHHAWNQGKTVLFISAEMLAADVFSRLDAMMGKFNPLILRDDDPAPIKSRLKRIKQNVADKKGEIIIPKTRLMTPQQIGAFAKNLQADLIIVDGAYLLQPSNGHFTSRWERVATVSNELKQLVLDLQLPLIGTAQIKRGASGEEGYDPEDIAYSDALGQDADFVGAIYPNKTIKERSEFQLIKNRFGPPCATQIYTDYDMMTITEESVKGAVDGGTISVAEWLGKGETDD